MRGREQRNTGSLFERLTIDMQTAPSRSTSIQVLKHSIMHNLNNVLNSRPGNSQSAPEMGIADPGSEEHTSGTFLEAQIEKIHRCILEYEPRITFVNITAAAQDANCPLDIRFQITAFVNLQGRENVLEFNVRFDGSKHYRMD